MTPVPESDIEGEFALLENVMLPVELPVAPGAKITEKVVLCPAASVTGTARPLIE